MYSAAKYFLQSSILEKYNVDPSRIGIAGDSAGGNLAAAVTQQVSITHLKVKKSKIEVYMSSEVILILITLDHKQELVVGAFHTGWLRVGSHNF